MPALLYAGIIGPRGDAYEVNRAITAEEAEEYHSEQLATLARAGVDLVEAMTFNSVPEAVGLSHAAARAGIASLGLVHTRPRHPPAGCRARSLKEAIETIDAQTGDDRPAFYGINCSHPLEFMPAIEPGEWFQRVRCLRPNAAMMDKISLCTLGHLESGDPAEARRAHGRFGSAASAHRPVGRLLWHVGHPPRRDRPQCPRGTRDRNGAIEAAVPAGIPVSGIRSRDCPTAGTTGVPGFSRRARPCSARSQTPARVRAVEQHVEPPDKWLSPFRHCHKAGRCSLI